MPDTFRHATGGQVCTQPLHIWKVTGKPCLRVFFDGELALDEVRRAVGRAHQEQVWGSEAIDVVCGECALSSLQLCIERQRREPELRRVADFPDGLPRVPHQKPSMVLVVRGRHLPPGRASARTARRKAMARTSDQTRTL